MKLTYCEYGYLPFVIPTVAANLVGPRTEYPIGFSIGQVCDLYWQAASYQLTASANATASGTAAEGGDPNPSGATISVQLSASATITRNASITNNFFRTDNPPGIFLLETAPTQLTVGRGFYGYVPGTGSTSGSDSSGPGTSQPTQFNIQVALFYPMAASTNPVVFCGGLYYPALGFISSSASSVGFKDGSAVIGVTGTTLADPNSTLSIGSFNFFGTSIDLYAPNVTGQSTTMSGSISVASTFS